MVSRNEFRTLVHQALMSVLEQADVSIGDDETFADYGVDSLQGMSLILELEELLGFELGEELNLKKLNTINTLYDYISDARKV